MGKPAPLGELDRSSTDAMHWAERFCMTLIKINRAKGQPTEIDVGWVQGWFANYWAAVHDPLHKKIGELESEIKEWESGALVRGWREEWEDKNG